MDDFYQEFKNQSKRKLNTAFLAACMNGELDKIKYLLTSPELTNHADINAESGYGFINACGSSQFETMEYLLNSPELKEHISIHVQDDYALIGACQDNDVEVAKYLLTSPNLKEHIYIHTKGKSNSSDRPFHQAYLYGRLEMIHYFIFEFNIEKTERIKKIIKNDPVEEISHLIENMFELREVNKNLNKDLAHNKEPTRKAKI